MTNTNNTSSKPIESSIKLVIPIDKPKKSSIKEIQVWSNNFISNWMYIWVLPIIRQALHMDFNELKLKLRSNENARLNANILDIAWENELASK